MAKSNGIVAKRYRHKWTVNECKKVLEYMKNNPFEQPNSVDYYKRMPKAIKMKLEASVIKSKITNMMRTYKIAKTLIAVNRDFPMTEVLEICPFYNELLEIFEKPDETQKLTPESKTNESEITENEGIENGVEFPVVFSPIETHVEPEQPAEEQSPIEFDELPSIPVDDPVIVPQLNSPPSEQELRLMELRLREKELKLRYFEIQSKERSLRLQLESKERIAMRKLDIRLRKYNN